MLVAQGLVVDVGEVVDVRGHAQRGGIDDEVVLPQDVICKSLVGQVASLCAAADGGERDTFLFQHILHGLGSATSAEHQGVVDSFAVEGAFEQFLKANHIAIVAF